MTEIQDLVAQAIQKVKEIEERLRRTVVSDIAPATLSKQESATLQENGSRTKSASRAWTILE